MGGFATSGISSAPATGLAASGADDLALEQAVQELLQALGNGTGPAPSEAGSATMSFPAMQPAESRPAASASSPVASAKAPAAADTPIPTLEAAANAVLHALSRGDTDGAARPAWLTSSIS